MRKTSLPNDHEFSVTPTQYNPRSRYLMMQKPLPGPFNAVLATAACA